MNQEYNLFEAQLDQQILILNESEDGRPEHKYQEDEWIVYKAGVIGNQHPGIIKEIDWDSNENKYFYRIDIQFFRDTIPAHTKMLQRVDEDEKRILKVKFQPNQKVTFVTQNTNQKQATVIAQVSSSRDGDGEAIIELEDKRRLKVPTIRLHGPKSTMVEIGELTKEQLDQINTTLPSTYQEKAKKFYKQWNLLKYQCTPKTEQGDSIGPDWSLLEYELVLLRGKIITGGGGNRNRPQWTIVKWVGPKSHLKFKDEWFIFPCIKYPQSYQDLALGLQEPPAEERYSFFRDFVGEHVSRRAWTIDNAQRKIPDLKSAESYKFVIPGLNPEQRIYKSKKEVMHAFSKLMNRMRSSAQQVKPKAQPSRPKTLWQKLGDVFRSEE